MKISEIAKILQVHKSTSWINEFKKEGGKMPIPQGKKKEKKEGK
jgi:transposase